MNITNNKSQFRFEATLEGGEVGYVEYRWLKGNMVLMHTIVPRESRRSGVGSALVKYVLDYARDHHLKIIIYCPFVEKYVREHPEYGDLKA